MMPTIVLSADLAKDDWDGVETLEFSSLDNFAQASALLLAPDDAQDPSVQLAVARWGLPLFISGKNTPSKAAVIAAAVAYERRVLPPFTRAVSAFVAQQRPTYACPGHQGGGCLERHPAGWRFRQLLGPGVFKVDVPHAAPELGDVLSHEGPVREAEQLAAKVFGADDTWFVLNGTSTANKVVASALLAAGDLVLMDRNNHKSVFLGALVQCGALAVYLESVRDGRGILGGYRSGALDEGRLRERAARLCPQRARQPRPFRLAVVQQATCDGVLVDASALLARIGHLCDYVLFDGAWAGYEPFVPALASLSPLAAPLTAESPGVLVTQSVHKQMSGLSQTSQIHKKDRHIQQQARHCSTAVFNGAFMQHASTSPSYALFMSLEINAAMLAEGEGQRHWQHATDAARLLDDEVRRQCRFISPLNAPMQQESATPYQPQGGPGIEAGLHYGDPCKAVFMTRGELAIPACIVTTFLRDRGFTPEKTDFYNFTLLLTPSSDLAGLRRLVACLGDFERLLLEQAPVLGALPSLRAEPGAYAGMTLIELCEQLNALYVEHQVDQRQSDIFSAINLAISDRSPHAANQQFVRGQAWLAPVEQALDKVAAEGVIPYPPGVMCITPGERWSAALVGYVRAIEAITRLHPAFAPHVQGVHELPGAPGVFGVYLLD
ncbi:ornithine decarboxylase [Pseudomonas sp. NPDC089406]|uniref:Orn/Lys/Arg family decarboxylase n=1 Tax=Pseudomonas sp. NPDC089406 TaxID=3364463 RepID=UPI00384B420D